MCLFLLLFVYSQMQRLFCRRNLKWCLGRINLRNENGINPSSLRDILKCMNSLRIASNISPVGLVQTSWNISGWQSIILFLLYSMLCCPFSKHNSQFQTNRRQAMTLLTNYFKYECDYINLCGLDSTQNWSNVIYHSNHYVCHIMSCHVMSCCVMPYHAMPYHKV